MKPLQLLPLTIPLLLALACSPPRSTWQQASIDSPPARLFAASAFDTERQRVVMFGGILEDGSLSAETWEFDGQAWHLRDDGTGPTPRNRMAMTYDPAHDEILAFGGYDGERVYNDMWAWNGETWRYVDVAGEVPPPRFNTAFAAEPATDRLVLFGGTDGNMLLGDTWDWDGESWQRVDADGPSRRHGHAMTGDPAENRLVLFGGVRNRPADAPPGFVPESGETWAFRDGGWELLTTGGPSPRSFASLAREQVDDRILLFGGSTGEEPLADLWQLEGNSWREIRSGEARPDPRYSPVFSTSPLPMVLVLYGGSYEEVYGDTWLLQVQD